MILPHPDDVVGLAAERQIPDDVAKELRTLAGVRETRRVRLMTSTADVLDEAAGMANEIRERFLWSMYPDHRAAVSWGWACLETLIGKMLPGEHHLVGARTGVGKTTALLNIVRHQLANNLPVRILPFETPPVKLLKLLGAVELRFDPRVVARGEWEKLPAEAPEALEEFARDMTGGQARYELTWARQGSMTPVEVYVELEKAADLGCHLVVLDHLHRIAIDGRNQESELRSLMRQLKDRVEKLDIVLLSGAQLNRGERDPLRRHLPPLDTDLRGAGALEEEADGVLGLYIPLVPGVTPQQLANVRKGITKAKSLVWMGKTGVRVIKHRIDGALVGEDVFLDYDHGRLTDPEPVMQYPLRERYT